MSSEWMKVMLDEIARKKAEAEQDQIELARRRAEREAAPESPAPPHDT
jgi:hypothetical protein